MSSTYQPVTLKDLPEAITALAAADRAGLLDLWREVIGAPPPKNLSLPFLRRALAFELQCQMLGGPKARTIEDLGRIVAGSASRASVGTKLRPGAKLVREWQGRTWTVEVIDGGFLMGGETNAPRTHVESRLQAGCLLCHTKLAGSVGCLGIRWPSASIQPKVKSSAGSATRKPYRAKCQTETRPILGGYFACNFKSLGGSAPRMSREPRHNALG